MSQLSWVRMAVSCPEEPPTSLETHGSEELTQEVSLLCRFLGLSNSVCFSKQCTSVLLSYQPKDILSWQYAKKENLNRGQRV